MPTEDTAVAQPRFQYPRNLFGSSLTAWNFGQSANTDLAVGVPGDGLQSIGASPPVAGICLTPPGNSIGAVEVLYGPLNLACSANQKFHQTTDFSTLGISLQGVAEAGDGFGRALY